MNATLTATDLAARIDRDPLADATAWIARHLPARPPVPVLGGVLIEAGEEGVSLSGFDYEVSARTMIAATVTNPGRVLVSAKLLADIAKALPNKPIDLTTDGTRVTVKCGSSRFTLPTMPVEDYPALPDLPESLGTVDAHEFAVAVQQVAVAAGRDDTLIMLTGIRMEITGGTIMLASTDRFRLAVRELEWTPLDPDVTVSALIPAKTLSDTLKHAGTADTISLSLDSDGRMLALATPTRRTTTRLLDAEFPNIKKLIPAEHATSATVQVEPLVAAIKRASLVTDRVAQIRMHWDGDTVTVTAGGDDVGDAEEAVPATVSGEPLLIGVNPVYVLDALGTVGTPVARFEFTTPNRPCLLLPHHDDEDTPVTHKHLLMPVRLPA